MQPEHESDELQALLREEYGAPPLDEQFSAGLIARLQAEATPTKTRARSRRPLLAICLGVAAIAASVVAVVWILNRGTPGTNYEVARRTKADSESLQRLELSSLAVESEEHARVDHLSASPRSMSVSPESESLPLRESLSDRVASESKYSRESLAQRKESLAAEERKPMDLSLATILSVRDLRSREWPNISAMAVLANMFYVVDSGRLYEVNTRDGSRRIVGDDRWQNTAALGAAGGYLYLVCDDQLYEVDPKTGARRSVGKPDWANTKAILTVGDKLYIASQGLLHRVNPSDGSHEVLHSKTESLNQSSQPKP
jgi:hypothetical protein